MRNTLLYLVFAFTILTMNGQNIGGHEEISDDQVKPWTAENKKDYESVYHFGDSEWEYDLVIVVTNQKSFAFIRRGEFNDDATDWIQTYEPLTSVKISGNRFYCSEFQGQFAVYNDGNKKLKGLKMLDKQTNDLHKGYEFGPQSYPITDFFSGKYRRASYKSLTESELESLSKEELQIMRNEIFARYGYTFIPDGKMDKYFRTQKWYKAQHKNVNSFLTELEKENIQKIKNIESKK